MVYKAHSPPQENDKINPIKGTIFCLIGEDGLTWGCGGGCAADTTTQERPSKRINFPVAASTVHQTPDSSCVCSFWTSAKNWSLLIRFESTSDRR